MFPPPVNSYPVFCTGTKTKTKTYLSYFHICKFHENSNGNEGFQSHSTFCTGTRKNQNSPYFFCIFAFAHSTKTHDHRNVLHPRQLPGSLRSSLPRRLQWCHPNSPNGLHFHFKCLKGSCFSFHRHFLFLAILG